MAYQVEAKTKRGGAVGSFVETARQALDKVNKLLDEGLTDVTVHDDDGNVVSLEELKGLVGN